MSENIGLKVLLSKLNEGEKTIEQQEDADDDDDDGIEFDCQYNLLCGLKIKVPTNERKKLSQWKEMARKVEINLENKRNERNRNLLEEIRKVELRMEKNRLQKMNARDDELCMKGNKSSSTFEENEELPFVYKFDNNTKHSRKVETNNEIHVTGGDQVSNSHDESLLAYEKLNGVNYMPEIKKHMESLHVLQTQQKELDSWYGNMQKQLEIEKVRLTEKYEELQLKNIREQQSIIDSSHEFLKCASNNNTPILANANPKQKILNDVSKNNRTPGSLKLVSTSLQKSKSPLVSSSLQKSKSPPIIQSSSLPIFKTPPSKMKSLDSECLVSDRNSMDYATPCASPVKNVNKEAFENDVNKEAFENDVNKAAFENDVQINGVQDYYSILTLSTETSPENAVSMSSSQCNKDVVDEPVNEAIEVDLQNAVNITYPVVVNEETGSCAKSLCIANGFSRLNLENDDKIIQSKSLPVSPFNKQNDEISDVRNNNSNSRVHSSSNFNINTYKENNNSIHNKSTIIPNERKTLITVPCRQTSVETVDSLELGRGSFEQLMKEHDFQSLESRRRSRPVKFFSNPFPGDYDDEVLSTSTRQITTHSPISSISLHQQQQEQEQLRQQQQEQEQLRQEQQQQEQLRQEQQQQEQLRQEQQQGQRQQVCIESYHAIMSPLKPNVSSHSPHSASPLRQHRLPQNNISEDMSCMSTSIHHYGKNLNGASHVASNSFSVVNNGPDHHITSTPEKFQEKRGVGLLLEISAVKLHEGENSKTSPQFTKDVNLKSKYVEKLQAVARGFLIRRLLKTLKVQDIIKTIKDTEEFLDDINKENINNQKLADRQLRVRLQDELSTKRKKLHDIFFNMDPRDQMKMLAISRAQVEEKHRKKQTQAKPVRSNPVFSRNISSSAGSGNLSIASQKSIKRRQTNNVIEKVPKSKPVSEKGINLKKLNKIEQLNKIESTGANIHVCIAGALKPIQSCTSPTMADRKKTKSPMKTNSVQNRYSKKSNVSKRLDMNAAVGNSQSGRFKSNVGLSSR